MKKENKILEEIYTVRTITAFSVFCALFVALLFVTKIDDLALYIASDYILAISATVAAIGAALWIYGKLKKETLCAFTAAFIGQLVFYSALSAVLFGVLVKDTTPSDTYGVLLAYGILVTALYTVYASAREAFSHALAAGMGIAGLYVARYFQGGSKFIPIAAALCVLYIAYAVFSLIRKRMAKSEKYAVCAATVFSIASAAIFAAEPPMFFYIIAANAALFIVTRLFVKL